jgi:formylmethanofuran dehydrogenase subunit E
MQIRKYSFNEFLECARSFHGYPAPGVILGGVMVEMAYQNLPEKGLFDAVSETRTCLPDSIQMLTPCTIGNGWLKVLDIGRFALTMYDKETGPGIRVCVDAEKIKEWDQLSSWFFKTKSKSQTDNAVILRQIDEAGTSILGVQHVKVNLGQMKKVSRTFAICPVCGEAYPVSQGESCLDCQGKLSYFKIAGV